MITVDLAGKTALVTGGAPGIGLATVEMFAKAGIHPSAASRRINEFRLSPGQQLF